MLTEQQNFDKIIKGIISTIEDMVLHNELSEDNNESLLVSNEQLTDYMDLSINIAAIIIAQAIRQIYRNTAEKSRELIYDQTLNAFEDVLKQQLATHQSTMRI